MKKIIAAVDFSPISYNAAYYAADLAVQMNVGLLLVNVVEFPITIWNVPESGYMVEKMIDGSENELKLFRTELLKHVNNRIAVDTLAPVGSVADCLQEEVKHEDAFCVVIGTDGLTPAEHLLMKNHALAAIHSITVPVLLIPEGTVFRPISKVLLAADLTGVQNVSALKCLKKWLSVFHSKLDVVSVVKGEFEPQVASGAHSLQYELAEFKPELHFIYDNDIKQAIENYLEQNKPDLLVTMPGKHGFFAGIFHKSRSKQLVRQPHIPVLSILE